MPSRKRNKGRTRKAKGSNSGGVPSNNDDCGSGPKHDDDDDLVNVFSNMNVNEENTCNHGCCEHVPPSCRKLLEALHELERGHSYQGGTVRIASGDILRSSEDALKSFCPEALSYEFAGETVKRFLLSKGTDEILKPTNRGHRTVTMDRVATIVLMIEMGYGSKNMNAIELYERAMKVFHGGLRELYRFYSKRLPCSCMKKPYAMIRSQEPKTAQCYHCSQRGERSALRLCSVCKLVPYCSRECQVAAWPEHKKTCARIAAERETLCR